MTERRWLQAMNLQRGNIETRKARSFFMCCRLSKAGVCNPVAVVNLVASSLLSNSVCSLDPETYPCGSFCSAQLDIVIPTQGKSIGFGKSFMFSLSHKESEAFQMGEAGACPHQKVREPLSPFASVSLN